MKYRKKPIVVDAICFDDSDECITALLDMGLDPVRVSYATREAILIIPTSTGEARACVGDYIIKGIQGEIYPCKPDIFTQTYEKNEPMMRGVR